MLTKSITADKYFYNNVEIPEAEYNNILEIIHNKPESPDGYEYRLNDNFEWELCELIVDEIIDDELTDEEAFRILMGGTL